MKKGLKLSYIEAKKFHTTSKNLSHLALPCSPQWAGLTPLVNTLHVNPHAIPRILHEEKTTTRIKTRANSLPRDFHNHCVFACSVLGVQQQRQQKQQAGSLRWHATTFSTSSFCCRRLPSRSQPRDRQSERRGRSEPETLKAPPSSADILKVILKFTSTWWRRWQGRWSERAAGRSSSNRFKYKCEGILSYYFTLLFI